MPVNAARRRALRKLAGKLNTVAAKYGVAQCDRDAGLGELKKLGGGGVVAVVVLVVVVLGGWLCLALFGPFFGHVWHIFAHMALLGPYFPPSPAV